MKYRVKITRTVVELWETEANNEADAAENWMSGELVDPDFYDNIDSVEVEPCPAS